MNSNALEQAYNVILENQDKEDFKMGDFLDKINNENQNRQKFSKKIVVTKKKEFLQNQDPLIPSKKVNKLQKIVDYYDEEIKQCKFNKIEVEDQPNKITDQILNKNKYQNQIQNEINNNNNEKSEIYKIANSLGIFNKVPPQKKIKLFETQEDEQNEIDKYNQNLSKSKNMKKLELSNQKVRKSYDTFTELQNEGMVSNKSKMSVQKKKEERRKFKMVQEISEMLEQFLVEQQSQIKNLKKKIQKKKQEKLKEQEQLLETSSEEENLTKSKTISQDVSKSLDDYEVQDDNNNSVEVNFDDDEVQQLKVQKQNMLAVSSKKEVIRKIHEQNKLLTTKNIPKIMIDIPQLTQGKQTIGKEILSNFTRFDIHQIFTIYKALHQTTSQRYKLGDYIIDNGMDKEVYRNGLYQIFMQCDELADDIFNTIDFNYSGWMDWDEFLKLMVIIRAKSLAEKINLFIKIADKNGDGSLEKDEIFNLAKACLGKYIIKQSQNDTFLNEICEYFTKLIFNLCEVDLEDEIPLKLIRKTVIKGQHQDNTLLCMFCGADI